jgi:UDP-N-acetylmuramyl pentapeptide synthase
MKSFFRSIVASLIALLARAIVRKYKPKIIMITGSVGKTSTKDAVASMLSASYDVRASEKSYNSEFGVPLTIIGAGNPWYDVFAWLLVIEEALVLILTPAVYPEMLVLEVGADRPNHLKQILKIATPDAVVVTRLPDIPVHVEAYASAEAVREEEFAPAYALGPNAPLIICADDEHAKRLALSISAPVSSFGFAKDATVHLSDVAVIYQGTQPTGMEVDALLEGKHHTLIVKGALGKSQIFAPAAALALAHALGLSLEKSLKGLGEYVPSAGRARILDGVNSSLLIDDTYNASPAAVEEVLNSLSMIEAKRKVVVLGDMLELGRYSVEQHERIGTLAASQADVVVSVGIRARALAESARKAGAKEVFDYPDSKIAGQELESLIQEGDVVLIKGSQSIRMERVVEMLLANKADTTKLIRQEKEWLEVK